MAAMVLVHLAGRTAMADGSILGERLRVSSAGTGGWHAGEPMDDRARASLERRGYGDHGHRARPFASAWFATTDVLVCLDRSHRQTLAGLARARAGDDRFEERLVLLRGFDPAAGAAVDVPDPYYGDDAGFDACLVMIESACRGLVAHLGGIVERSCPGQAIARKDSAS